MLIQPEIHRDISHDIDLFLIIQKMSEDKLSALSRADIDRASLALFNMIGFINFTLAKKFAVLQRKALSVRDVINALEFIEVALPLFAEEGEAQLTKALFHAVSLVIMDGLCLGIDVAGDRQKEQISGHCNDYLDMILREICWTSWKRTTHAVDDEFINTD